MTTKHEYNDLRDGIEALTDQQRYPFHVAPRLSLWQAARLVELADEELRRINKRAAEYPESRLAPIDRIIIEAIRDQVAEALAAGITEAGQR